uniref:Metalloendopeptidase n=1 Tax=Hypomesus nipponensis TaxID=182223 RepID=E2RWN2_9TELE|nr:hatching enzyme [Hypomesus nipponensis]
MDPTMMDNRKTVMLLLLVSLALSQDLPAEKKDPREVHIGAHKFEKSNHTILQINKDSNQFFLEGDIATPKTRTAIKCTGNANSCLWKKSPNGKVEVPYIIDSLYSQVEKDYIEYSMKDFASQTCVRFVPRKQQSAYLHIIPKNGCFSGIGCYGDKQTVSLSKAGCLQKGIIQHELIHSLGFFHEHTRSDRDNYVRIDWSNVRSPSDFAKEDTNNLNTPYDYSSIMHYDKYAFAEDRTKPTIIPIPNANVDIGQRVAMSAIDVQRINKLYNC